jgi:uncharacterized protein (DUF924 family)
VLLFDRIPRNRFGCFPHRTTVLGQRATPAELRAVARGNAWQA